MQIRRLKTKDGRFMPKETHFDTQPEFFYSRFRRQFLVRLKDKDGRIFEVAINDDEFRRMWGSVPANLVCELYGVEKSADLMKCMMKFAARTSE